MEFFAPLNSKLRAAKRIHYTAPTGLYPPEPTNLNNLSHC